MIPMNRDLRRKLAAGALAGGLIAAPAVILSPAVAELWERAGIEKPSLATDPSLAMLMMMKMSGMLSGGDAGGGGLNIANLFATTLYTGNGTGQTITNGVNLSSSGGLVWRKMRSDAFSHVLNDSGRSNFSGYLRAHSTDGETSGLDVTPLTTGFSFSGGSTIINGSGSTFVAWSFARAARFFDVVTWTGNGVAGRQISHNLSATPGMMIVKKTNGSESWLVYHRSLGATNALLFDLTSAQFSAPTRWNDTEPTSSVLTVGVNLNILNDTYVAYLFAHDTAADGVVQCGSYTGNGSSSGPTVTLGWQPQWLMVKRANNAGGWWIFDTARGLGAGIDRFVAANTSDAEDASIDAFATSSTGFQPVFVNDNVNGNGSTYIFVAIRAAA